MKKKPTLARRLDRQFEAELLENDKKEAERAKKRQAYVDMVYRALRDGYECGGNSVG